MSSPSIERLSDAIQAVLFVADGPLTENAIAEATLADPKSIRQAISLLAERLKNEGGLCLTRIAGGYQLSTKPEYAEECARLLNPPIRRLTRAALETLAIVAYRQPVTQSQVDALRGVDSSHSIKLLIEKGLIEERGRKPTPGRPLIYGVTDEFLHYFGLADLTDLPPLDSLVAVALERGDGAHAIAEDHDDRPADGVQQVDQEAHPSG